MTVSALVVVVEVAVVVFSWVLTRARLLPDTVEVYLINKVIFIPVSVCLCVAGN